MSDQTIGFGSVVLISLGFALPQILKGDVLHRKIVREFFQRHVFCKGVDEIDVFWAKVAGEFARHLACGHFILGGDRLATLVDYIGEYPSDLLTAGHQILVFAFHVRESFVRVGQHAFGDARAGFEALRQATQADEFILVSDVFDPELRLRSLSLAAEAVQ